MFGNIFTLYFIILICFFQSIRCNIDSLRIFQGRDAVPGEFPYAVALAMKFREGTQSHFYINFCSGSIVTPVWTLTAGHCVEFVGNIVQNNTSGQSKMVIRFEIYLEKNHEWGTSDVINTVLHPGYKSNALLKSYVSIINDVALLKTNKVTISVLGVFSSIDYSTLYGHKIATVGFGLTKSEKGVNDALSLNKTVQVYEAIVVKCTSILALNVRLLGTIRPVFCMSWHCNKPTKSCGGDSGGPVIHPTGIIGIVTASDRGACDSMKTAIFAGLATSLSPSLNWIVRQIRDT